MLTKVAYQDIVEAQSLYHMHLDEFPIEIRKQFPKIFMDWLQETTVYSELGKWDYNVANDTAHIALPDRALRKMEMLKGPHAVTMLRAWLIQSKK